MNFKPAKPLHLFKAGTHTPMGGQPIVFTNAMVKGMADCYDPALHKAPLVVGHPQNDSPAHGWFKGSLQYKEEGGVGNLYAAPDIHNAKFADAVRKGYFAKLSAAFYTPDSPTNPSPGNYCLRHVGAVPIPSVKGLADIDLSVELGDAAVGVVSFADGDDGAGSAVFADSGSVAFGYSTAWGFESIAALFRKLRDRLIETDGLEAANKTFNDYDLANIESAARREREEVIEDAAKAGATNTPFSLTPSFSEGELTVTQVEELAAIKAQNTALLAQIDTIKADKAKAKTAADAAFAEGLVAAAHITPAQKPALLALLAVNAEVVSFSEPDGTGVATDAATGAAAFSGSLHQAISALLVKPSGAGSALFGELSLGGAPAEDQLVKMAKDMGLAKAQAA